MKFLIDTSPIKLSVMQSDLIGGQLITPLTSYSNYGGVFAIDNGAYSEFDAKGFARILDREQLNKTKCLFVTVPDVVGNARRTLEIWQHRHKYAGGWPMALVAQDGIEDMEIPWADLSCIFVGGRDPWKDSLAVADIVKTGKILGKHVHVGRVNTLKRFIHFDTLGADTCDGSGIAKYDHMLQNIEAGLVSKLDQCMIFDNGNQL